MIVIRGAEAAHDVQLIRLAVVAIRPSTASAALTSSTNLKAAAPESACGGGAKTEGVPYPRTRVQTPQDAKKRGYKRCLAKVIRSR